LVDATRQLRYKGHVAPGILMVGGPPCALEVLRAAWARNVLRPPADHVISCLGEHSTRILRGPRGRTDPSVPPPCPATSGVSPRFHRGANAPPNCHGSDAWDRFVSRGPFPSPQRSFETAASADPIITAVLFFLRKPRSRYRSRSAPRFPYCPLCNADNYSRAYRQAGEGEREAPVPRPPSTVARRPSHLTSRGHTTE
jgi:hypothetical protein